MKILHTTLIATLLSLLLLVSACSAPPEDLPSAQIGEASGITQEQTQPEEVQQQTNELGTDTVPQGTRVNIDTQASTLEFEGYKPGDSHLGTFNEWEGTMFFDDGIVTELQGTVQLSSVETDSQRLDEHLQSEDFFYTEMYPTATFQSTNVSVQDGAFFMTGDLTFRGVTQSITFPVEFGPNYVAAEFRLDTTPFGFEYVLVNKEIRVDFTFVAE